jgi:cytosine/adenosine deaminase-related metal-dependent hydrolase
MCRDERVAAVLADTVASYRGILGAAVCCSDDGGLPHDDWTTCERDRDELLDHVFSLAKSRGLLLDFHVDENGNEESKGLRDIARKTIEHGYQGKVVCGHCWCVSCTAVQRRGCDLDARRSLRVIDCSGGGCYGLKWSCGHLDIARTQVDEASNVQTSGKGHR